MPRPIDNAVAPVISDRPLAYVDRLETRALDAITAIVMHCTELPDLATARAYGERVVYPSGTGNSGHYYIDRDGRIERWVPDNRIAHHVRDCNRASIGIELVNAGRWPEWHDSRMQKPTESYSAAQIDALIALLIDLQGRLPNLIDIAGHEDLDRTQVEASDDAGALVQRKIDPGPLFPWQEVLDGSGLRRVFGLAG
jgi:N-acetylmuramoyl-L-alanine amidase